MKLTNYTEVPDELLREIVRFVCPSNVSGFDIVFKNDGSGDMHGQTYPGGTEYHKRTGVRKGMKRTLCPPLLSLHIPKGFDVTRRLKHTARPKIKGTAGVHLGSECFTNEERLVSLVAHHFRYMWQYKVPKGWRVWGARGKYSHRDAYAYAIRMTRAWRRRSTLPESKFTIQKKEAEALLAAEMARRLKERPPIRRLRV